jgi:hypothetical protein
MLALFCGFLAFFAAASLLAAPVAECYKVEDIVLPAGVPPEVGAITFDADGVLYVALRRGDIIRAKPAPDPKGFPWKPFATGFENGCGIVAPAPGRVLVAQMAELTEAADTDGDGEADRYRTIADDWGLSGNYHETNAIVSDGKGGYFLLLGTASHNGPTFEHSKGEYSKFGRRGRNFSAVKWRGWTVRLTADGRIEPFASGFRMQNGGTLDDEGNLWSSDNQGDWKAVTPLYHVRQGKFYGHPSSLVWDPSWPADKDPLLTYRNDLAAYNAHRTPAAVEIPHTEICRSGSEPIQIPRSGSFGPFAGQMLLPDNNGPRIARVMLEKVGGEYQGAVTQFFTGNGLRSGNNRTRFSPDGKALYIGQTVRGWGRPSEGLQRITWTGKTPFTIATINLTTTGFRLTFTEPVGDAARAATSYTVKSMIYQPRWTYGSAPEDVRDETVGAVKAIDARTIEIALGTLQAGRVYKLVLADSLETASGEKMGFRDFYYTANRLLP